MAYATVPELQTLLRIASPTALQTEGMERVLDAAAEEIDWYLDVSTVGPLPSPAPALVQEVNLERAVELWQQSWSPFGIIGLGAETPIRTARDTWYRHAQTLRPLKTLWGVG